MALTPRARGVACGAGCWQARVESSPGGARVGPHARGPRERHDRRGGEDREHREDGDHRERDVAQARLRVAALVDGLARPRLRGHVPSESGGWDALNLRAAAGASPLVTRERGQPAKPRARGQRMWTDVRSLRTPKSAFCGHRTPALCGTTSSAFSGIPCGPLRDETESFGALARERRLTAPARAKRADL